jgi:outer membrane protein assembly factor BamB
VHGRVLAIVLAPLLAHGAAAGPVTWTQFRANEQNDPTFGGNLHASWRLVTGAGFSASPTLVGRTLYIGNNGGTLYAIDAQSGNVRWMQHVAAPLMSNPLVLNGLVIVGEGDQNSYFGGRRHPVEVGKGENRLLAFEAADGSLTWSVPLEGSGMPTPAFVDGLVVQHNGSGQVVAVDPSTGSVRYTRDLFSTASMSAILPIDDDRFVTNGIASNTVFALNVADGSPVWRHDFDQNASGVGDCPAASAGPYVVCDYLYLVNPTAESVVGLQALEHAYALDEDTGAIAWDVTLERGTVPAWNEAAIPLVHGGRVFLGSSIAPAMHALDAKTGIVLWRRQVYGAVKGGVAEKDGVVYFGDLGGYLWALNERTGDVIGDTFMGTPFNVGSPIIGGDTLFIGSQTGTLLAVPLESIRARRDPAPRLAATPNPSGM